MDTENPVIKVHVENEKDLYEIFDEDQKTLNGALIRYLERQHNRNRHGDIPTIRFISEDRLDEARLKAALVSTVETAIEENRQQRRRARWSELYLFLLGLVSIVLGIALTNVTGIVYLQLLSLTAAFAIKEAASVQFLTIPKLKLEARRLRFVSRGKVEVI